MGMKRFSAPPVLYPNTIPAASPAAGVNHHHHHPHHLLHHHNAPFSSSAAVTSTVATAPTNTSSSSSTPTSGWGHHHPHHNPVHPHHQHQQQQHHLHHHNHHHHHDPSSKRVKTEQTFESLFDKEAHSDVTISVNNDECVFHAHRVILEMKSDVIASLLTKQREKGGEEAEGVVKAAVAGEGRPILYVREDPECAHVFSRFLYFLYSGAVWLHQDYVLPLFRLALRYRVKPLRTHCETYILQVLAKSCGSSSSSSSTSSTTSQNNRSHNNHNHHINNNNNNNNIISNQHHHHLHNHSPPSSANSSGGGGGALLASSPNGNSPPYAGSGFALDVVCDLYEGDAYEGDIQQTAFRLLCCQFRQLVRSQRWLRCGVLTVCNLIGSDHCNVEENLILVSATDFMKRNNLADKKQIEDILSLIRYPRLNRRVLYHLQKNGSFKNFPHIQELMVGALKYHSFKDLPEAKDDFVGPQFRPRMSGNAGSSPSRRASVHVGASTAVTDPFPPETTTAVFMESAYSLEPGVPVVLTHSSRQSQV